MDITNQAISALRRIGIVALIAVAFLFGLSATVYLSLRSPEVKVPDVVGKDRFEAEKILAAAELNFRVRATRPSNQFNADTVLFQMPRAGEVVKVGQTVAMDISRSAKAGEASEASVTDDNAGKEESRENRNTARSSTMNDNENRAMRNRNTNKNANENSNVDAANLGANASGANANSVRTNANSVDTREGDVGSNANANSGRTPNENENKQPRVARPSPTAQNNNR